MMAALGQDATGERAASLELLALPDEIDPGPEAGVEAPLSLTGMCDKVLGEVTSLALRQARKQLWPLLIQRTAQRAHHRTCRGIGAEALQAEAKIVSSVALAVGGPAGRSHHRVR